ncbi:carbohydrate ABC transporter substrate-binding protein [Faecalibacterium prausnitzii]|uniref:Carbohydrate ABC transporter substrate-binding protein n=1 Tax=Faecalibacterium prausnitzii TaxID=853 RepID=A0A3E2U913_9FIRM|nr:ABC transporter substrate-binding protein [Faecalibacterium prausnitzii]RGB92699.1 carbohydrate ABC transporter substrate-binding protein [Faecalibacterium prausnitzii]
MNKRTLRRLFSVLMALVMAVSMLTSCGTKNAESVEKKEDAQTIQVYLWTNNLYETYAPYIQSQLPDVNIEFIVGNNDLDFYKFLQENGGLPDIITSCRFSLHDAAPLKDSLMNLALTNEAGAVYNTYLNSFKNEDGSVNWLPVCADAHGFVVNRSLFEQYGIPLPTDYESFVSACQAFEKAGIRGFTADYTYDYTCMETLQGLSAAELTTTDGRKWRTAYSDPASTARVGLDDTVWPGAFERMAQFIQDTHLTADDLALNYDDVTGMFRNGEVAMYFGSSAGVKMFQDEGIDTIFLPFFSQNGEKWIMTTPYFQIALNRDLEQDTARREKAMKVLNVMLSEEAQSRIVADGQDVLSYSQNVPLRLTEYMKDVRDVVEENHMYIRIASNDFFAVSKDVVSKMIAGEYTAQQAYRAFNAQLLAEDTPADDEIVLTSGKSYSNVFHANGGSASFSVMANTLRGVYGTDVLLATANSFTGSILRADYNKKMAASMIMPNGLMSRQRTMTGAELKETVRAFVEGCEGGFVPFNRGSLPVVSGIAVEVKEASGSYTLTGITRNGQPLRDDDTVTVTCLAAEKQMEALLASESGTPLDGDTWVKNRWRDHVSGGGAALAEPENYMILR